MRRIVVALAASLSLVAGYAVPGVGATSPPGPKVVIIVGPVGSMTSSYRTDADAAYAEALKYTSNVVKVYTPNATWAAARAAMQGASIVVYLGHGNGFPSPYRTSPWPYSQNGLGLNPKAGGDNSTTQYWGEYYLARDVKLAPNAVVLLHHLCYASGNSEPGNPAPGPSVARQRVDNMAAGWLRSGARAVVAEAHFGPAWYIRQLFTTHRTIDQIWHASPTFNGRAFSFLSSRTAGAKAEMDPDGTPGGYWRALTGWLGTTTDQVTGAAYAPTDGDPLAFSVPGNATVNVLVSGLYPDATLTPDGGTMLPPLPGPAQGTRLRILARGDLPTFDGATAYQVGTFPDGTPLGWMSSVDLTPRDSASPVVWTVDDGDGAFSPNGDGSGDTYKLSARLSETADWTLDFKAGDGNVLATKTGTASTVSAGWSGLVSGAAVPDGTYRWTLSAVDGWANPPGTGSGTFRVDTVAPAFDDAAAASATTDPSPIRTFSPNGDGSADTIAFGYSMNEPGYVDVTVRDASDARVRSFSVRGSTGTGSVSWDGTSDAGTTVKNGLYTVRLAPRDEAGNVGAARAMTVGVYKTLKGVTASKTLFYPQDRDSYARSTRFGFSLTSGATVTATIRNGAGQVVLTRYAATTLAAGPYAFVWNGRASDGSMVRAGRYTLAVTATDGTLAATSSKTVVADAFRVSLSDATPARGQRITVSITTAETLTSLPRLSVTQPRLGATGYTFRRTGTSTYRVTFTLKRSGSAGNLRLSVRGVDRAGGTNRTTVFYPIH